MILLTSFFHSLAKIWNISNRCDEHPNGKEWPICSLDPIKLLIPEIKGDSWSLVMSVLNLSVSFPINFGNATRQTQSNALNCFEGMKQLNAVKICLWPSISQKRSTILLCLFTSNVTSTLRNSGNKDTLDISLSWIHASATSISLPSLTLSSSLQHLTSSMLMLLASTLISLFAIICFLMGIFWLSSCHKTRLYSMGNI